MCGVAVAEEAAPCPVPLVEVTSAEGGGDGLTLSERGLSYLSSLTPPLFVVPAVGVYRSGKSHMLNRLRGLTTPYEGGFGVGHTRDTFTRGIHICGEAVEGLGTVVWMDTEGLFSAEEAEGSYGPKIFSLALLFSSTVLLNSKSVLSNEFFNYFAEQQQVARVLRQGLSAQGFPEDTLLPRNLSLIWVLQQPQHFDGTGAGAQEQLERFLDNGEEARRRVRDDFRHMLREVPVVAYDTRKFSHIESLTDAEILPEYLTSVRDLRGVVLQELGRARPLHASGIVAMLRMYAELVRTSEFSSKLVLEVFEESELGALCAGYSKAITDIVGALPVRSLEDAFQEPLEDVERQRAEVAERYHLSDSWQKRLDQCLRKSEGDLRRRNSEKVLSTWKAAAAATSEEGSCFFLDQLVRLQRNYSATYGATFDAAVLAQAVEFGSTLQRTRLVECIRLRDLLWPFVPWLVGPVCGLYFRAGPSGVITMLLHIVVVAGIYVLMQTFGQLPGFLDVDYAVLRRHPALLEALIRWVPPLVPWASVARGFGTLGAMRSAWKILCCGLGRGRPSPSDMQMASCMNVLVLQSNTLLSRSHSAFKERIDGAALSAAERLHHGDRYAAYLALLRGLMAVASVEESDMKVAARLSSELRARVRAMLKAAHAGEVEASGSLCSSCVLEQAVLSSVSGDWDDLAVAMLETFAELAQETQKRRASVVVQAPEAKALAEPAAATPPFRTPEKRRGAESRSVSESEPEPMSVTPRESLRRTPGTAQSTSLLSGCPSESGEEAAASTPARRSLWGWFRGAQPQEAEEDEGPGSRRTSLAESEGADDGASSLASPEKARAQGGDEDDVDPCEEQGAPQGSCFGRLLTAAAVGLGLAVACGLFAAMHVGGLLPGPRAAA